MSKPVSMLLPFLVAASPAVAQRPAPSGVGELVERQETNLRSMIGLASCPDGEADEIIVCGRRDNALYRVPPSIGALPGTRVVGEAADARAFLTEMREDCNAGPRRPNPDKFDILAAAVTVAALVASAIEAPTPKAEPVKKCN